MWSVDDQSPTSFFQVCLWDLWIKMGGGTFFALNVHVNFLNFISFTVLDFSAAFHSHECQSSLHTYFIVYCLSDYSNGSKMSYIIKEAIQCN